jgi:putative cell wall-binding protein
MSKVVRLTESELNKIVRKVMSEDKGSTYEMYTRYIQRADDDLASCVQSTMQTLQDLKDEIELDTEISDKERSLLIRFIENVEDTYN